MAAIIFEINADTGQASGELQSFLSRFNEQLLNVQKAAASAASGAAKIPKAVEGASEAMSKMREASMVAKEGFHSLETAVLVMGAEHMPGLVTAVTSARMAMLTMRSAAQLTGLSLGTVIPVVGAIGAVIATGIVAWQSYKESMG